MNFEHLSWNDGRRVCRRSGYELWSVDSHEEWDAVYEKMAFLFNTLEIVIIGLRFIGDPLGVSNIYILSLYIAYTCIDRDAE